ncbi:MAG: hypothetical protein R2911_12220 [Caldilineaceae bacterium]
MMKQSIVILRLHPYKHNDPVLILDVVHPVDEGFQLLSGLLVHETEEWLLDFLAIQANLKSNNLFPEEVDSMYYYYFTFREPGMVEITHEYQPGYLFRLSYANLEKIVNAILEFRRTGVERYVNLELSKQEGPYLLPDEDAT